MYIISQDASEHEKSLDRLIQKYRNAGRDFLRALTAEGWSLQERCQFIALKYLEEMDRAPRAAVKYAKLCAASDILLKGGVQAGMNPPGYEKKWFDLHWDIGLLYILESSHAPSLSACLSALQGAEKILGPRFDEAFRHLKLNRFKTFSNLSLQLFQCYHTATTADAMHGFYEAAIICLRGRHARYRATPVNKLLSAGGGREEDYLKEICFRYIDKMAAAPTAEGKDRSLRAARDVLLVRYSSAEQIDGVLGKKISELFWTVATLYWQEFEAATEHAVRLNKNAGLQKIFNDGFIKRADFFDVVNWRQEDMKHAVLDGLPKLNRADPRPVRAPRGFRFRGNFQSLSTARPP